MKKKKVKLLLQLEPEMRNLIVKRSKKAGISYSDYIRKLVMNDLMEVNWAYETED